MGDLGQVFTLSWLEWLFAVELLGLAALPLSALLFRAFPDRGYAFSKPLGILLVAFVNWWLGSLASLANYPVLLWLTCLLVAGGGAALYFTGILARPTDPRSLIRIAAIEEVLFLAAFVIWTLVRSQNPDIYSTEKPMDFMLLQVSGMSHSFPPPDAWLSGHTVNYYYLGYAIFATIGKMAAVDPRLGFNLANITIFALGATGAYGLGLALTKSLRWAAVSTFAVVLAGDLDAIAQVVSQIRNGGLNEGGLNLWCSTRIIDGGCGAYHTITEFPIFSLLWNDLHPHVMDIPFVLLAMAVGIHALYDPPALDRATTGKYIRLGAASIVLGALFAINSWDYPAYTLFAVGAMLLALYRNRQPSTRALGETFAVIPISLIIYLPYFLTVHSSKGIGLLANPTALGDLVTVIGGVLAPPALYVMWRAAMAVAEESEASEGANTSIVASALRGLPVGGGWWIVYGVLIICFVWSGRTDFLYVILLLAGLYAVLSRRRVEDPAAQATLLLALTAVFVLFVGDFAYLRDNFDGSANYRMNTVFKLFYQAWILLAAAAPYAVFSLTRAVRAHAPEPVRWAWYTLALGLGLCMAVYPIEGVGSQTQSAAISSSLDGLAYLRDVDPDEYAVISWVRDHTNPSDVVAEGFGSDYWVDLPQKSANKMSALTGRPTIIGWPGSHEALWRGDYGGGSDAAAAGAMLAQRKADVKTLYTTADQQTALRIIRTYHIAYLYVGPFEQSTYGTDPRSPAKFKSFLTTVVQRPSAVLYRVSINS